MKMTNFIKYIFGKLRSKQKECLSSDYFTFRYAENSRLGAILKNDNLGKVSCLEIWSVDPFPDDHSFLLLQIFPSQVKAIKDFLELFEHSAIDEKH